jgi:hypothetical protein
VKQCFKCLCVKPLADFYAHKKAADGRMNKCKECTRRDVGEHRAANLEKIRAYDRARSNLPHRKDLRKRVTSEWMSTHPERRAAQVKLGNAVRDGRIQRWPCEICGDKADAHHPHYGAPLLVTWLCRQHHKQAHAESG